MGNWYGVFWEVKQAFWIFWGSYMSTGTSNNSTITIIQNKFDRFQDVSDHDRAHAQYVCPTNEVMKTVFNIDIAP